MVPTLYSGKRSLAAVLLCAGALILAAAPATAQLAAAHSWQRLSPLPVPADSLAAVSLSDGSVLAVGGDAAGGNRARLALRYNVRQGVWQRLPDAPVPLATPALLAIDPHRVLVVAPSFASGGRATPSRTLTLDPIQGRWQVLPSCPVPLLQPRLIQLRPGTVFAAGGVGNAVGALLSLATMRWSVVPAPVPNLATYAVAALPHGQALLAASVAITPAGTPTAVRRAFALQSGGRWRELARPLVAGDVGRAVALDNGRVLLAGGYPVGDDPRAAVPPAQIYDPVRNRWTTLGTTGSDSRGAQLVPLPGGRALLVGGHGPTGLPSPICMLFDGQGWRPATSLPGPWSGYALTPFGAGNVLLIGGDRPIGNGFAMTAETLVLVLTAPVG